MKITVKQDPKINETEITITCREIDTDLETIISNLSLIDNTAAGKIDGETYFIPMTDIFYFETVDSKTFFYTGDKVFELSAKLYQLEEKLIHTPFVRISKSVIVNLKKVESIKPEENSRLTAKLSNNEKVTVSRQYMPGIKKKLGV